LSQDSGRKQTTKAASLPFGKLQLSASWNLIPSIHLMRCATAHPFPTGAVDEGSLGFHATSVKPALCQKHRK
jgi:hypothetical protein